MENMRDKFIENGIPYDELDVEMVELINVLNFDLGLKTKFCCYGHSYDETINVMFDESVSDEQIINLADKACRNWKDYIGFKKWVRGLSYKKGWELGSNWTFEIYKYWHVLEEKEEHLKKVVEVLKRCAA